VSEQNLERKRRVPPVVIVAVIMAAICGISLYIRIALPYDQVFVKGSIWFSETDAYYYMRNIETLVHNFPHFNSFDPYILFPGGAGGLSRPFFAWLIAGITLLVTPGVPSLHSMEVVAAYMPAILGTLTLIPVYFIGKELFNRWAGVIAAALAAILPGEFLHRSLLGFTDHHVAEVLFSTVCILFLIMAVKRAREREISFKHILNRDWSVITRPLIYTLLAGIFLGLYLLVWQGGLLFIFIIFVYLVIQFVVDHLGHKSSDYLCIVGTPLFLVAFLMLLPVLGVGEFDALYRLSMPIAIVVPIVLSVISRLMASRALKPLYYPLALLGLLGIGLAVLYAINPSLFQSVFSQFSVFTPAGARLTIMEVHPLSLQIAWSNFNTSFFISFISLAMLIYVAGKEKGADKILFLVWSILMLIALFGQRRFGYYYTINAALLTGYFSWKMLDVAGLRKLLAKPKEVVGAVKKFKKDRRAREKAKKKTSMQPRGAWVNVIVVGVILFFLVIFPSTGLFWRDEPTKIGAASPDWFRIGITRYIAETPNPIMTEGWYSSCSWLQDNSPEPFGDPDFYYELYPPKAEFEYPETAYGVMSWWDYGYFIMQIGHRIPNANPGQAGAVQAGEFFISQSESSANELADELGTKYVMIDYPMATPAKFYAMADWAGNDSSEFYDIYYLQTSSGWQGMYLFYPAYYNSAVVRLYNFDAKAAVSTQPMVIAYQEQEIEGETFRIITNGPNPPTFPSYEDAQAYVAAQTSGTYRIVGTDPFTSIVSLEELDSYQLVYPLEGTINTTAVKVFERLG
jgi:oligosaccharyl transferase (archaeosortase A-associated)